MTPMQRLAGALGGTWTERRIGRHGRTWTAIVGSMRVVVATLDDGMFVTRSKGWSDSHASLDDAIGAIREHVGGRS